MLAELLPPAVRVVESYGPLDGEALLPEEEPLIVRAVERRRAEFTTARSCARQALAQLGVPPAPVLIGPAREPVWPAGVVGSLTHCDGYRAAAVARRAEVASLGIDAEPHLALPDGVLDRVTLPAERRALGGLPAGVRWDRLLFSAKESVYKAWYPLTGRWLGFEDARVELDPGGSFEARLLDPDADPPAFVGGWTVRDGLLGTAVVLSAGR
jgi:enterobactin synthetase component D / holo-[acyl-carrier protein] synthase